MDIQSLKERWPLFEFKVEARRLLPDSAMVKAGSDTLLTVYLNPQRGESSPSIIYWFMPNPDQCSELDKEHKLLEIRTKWGVRYPHLYFWINRDTMQPVGAWVIRNGFDRESVGKFDIQYLYHYEEQAKLAIQPGWFYCTHCQKAYSQESYGYYYFSDVRCKDCANPAWLKSAREESYN
jgi:hypothetical protein